METRIASWGRWAAAQFAHWIKWPRIK